MTIRGKSTDGLVSRLINRRISTRITKIILKYNLGITPNQVSIISFLLSILSFPLYLFNQNILAGILVQISSIIDGVDGELARALNMASKFGAFFDAILDRIADITIIFGMTLNLIYYSDLMNLNLIYICLGALSGCLMVSYLHSKSKENLGVHPALIGSIPMFASRDVRLFIIFIGSILGFIFESLIIIFMITYLYSISKFIELIYIFKSKQL